MDMPLTLPVALNYLTLAVLLLYLYKKVKFLLHMFQQKGYKLNEFDIWLRKAPFKHMISIYELLFVGICVLVQYALQPIITTTAHNLIFAIFSVSWFAFHDFYGGKQIKKPLVSTARMKRLYVSTAIFMFFWPLATLIMDRLYGQGQLDIAFISGGFIISASLSSFIVMLAAWVNKPIEDRIQEGFKQQARQKLKALKHLKTIAITGSYGKTSVKFMIQAILRTRYQV
jgi:UDP-N-acetylmuramoyl-tripeptide--D-alanyl-D-alanine ligase